jgi:hypothetical protein
MDNADSFLGVKAADREADHSHTPGAKVKNEWKFTLPLAFFKVEQERETS